MPLVPDPKNCDISVKRAIQGLSKKLGYTGSPTHANITLTDLTASLLIGANADKLLESVTVGTGLDYTRPTLSLSHLGIEALTDPGADRIFFWDETADASKWLSVGNSIAITTTTIDTIQDIQTSATPLFAGLIVANGGYIGSVGDNNAIQIAANGEVSFTDVATGILPTAGAHLATKEYVDLAIGASADFFLSNNDDAVIADYHILYETDTGEASSELATAAMGEANNQLMFSYITASGVPGVEFLRAGVYILHTHLAKTTGTKPTKFYWTLSKYTIGDVETVILTSEVSSAIPTSEITFRTHATLAADSAILDTDRLVLKLYANVEATGSNSIITIYMEGTHDCHLTNQLPSSIWQNQGDVLDDLNTLGIVGADSEFIVGTGAGTYAHENAATAATSMGLGTGDSPTFTALSLGTGELTCGSINRASGTLTLEIGGTAELSIASAASTFGGNIIIPNAGNIGSVSDTDAIQIEADGDVVFSQKVGISLTPIGILDIGKNGSDSNFIRFTNVGSHPMASIEVVSVSGFGGTLGFRTQATGANGSDRLTTQVTIDEDGYVGFGTINPGQVIDARSIPTVLGDGRINQFLFDNTGMAAGVGGGLAFAGNYTAAGAQTTFAGIWGEKENANEADFAGQLHLGTRVAAGSISSDLIIDSLGDVDIPGNFTAGTIQADDGFTGTGAYTNFTIVGGIITAAS